MGCAPAPVTGKAELDAAVILVLQPEVCKPFVDASTACQLCVARDFCNPHCKTRKRHLFSID